MQLAINVQLAVNAQLVTNAQLAALCCLMRQFAALWSRP